MMTILIVAAMAGSAAASVDPSPKPGGVYRLKPGIYVAKGSSCESPPNAATLRYDGKALSDAHSNACRVRIVSHRGNAFVVDQSCIAVGMGRGPRVVRRQTIRVQDALTFTQRFGGPATAYRYCPVHQLPAEFRSVAR